MKRHDWASRLYAVVEAHQARPFVWGVDDCCLFVARAVDAQVDSTYEQQLRAVYQNETGALGLIALHGGLAGAVTAFLGEPVEERATRGDVVLIDGGESDALAICLGSQVVAMGPEGLRRLPRSEILMVWKPWER